jgi:hypothetical protein
MPLLYRIIAAGVDRAGTLSAQGWSPMTIGQPAASA